VCAVREVCIGLAVAAAWLRPEAPGLRPALSAPRAGKGDMVTSADLQQLCTQAALPFTMRGSDTAMVELEVPGAFQQAAVELQPHRGVVVSVPVLSELPRAPVCEAAVGGFLLRVSGAVRMVRAATGTSRVPVCFEVVRPAIPTPVEIAEAYAALSLAWRWAGREAAVLAVDQRVAELYVRSVAVDVGPSPVEFSTLACGQSPQ